MRPAACHRGQGICGGRESNNDKKHSKGRGHLRRGLVGKKPGLDLDLVCISPFPEQGPHSKRRDRLLKRCLLPNWRTRRTGRARVEDKRHLVLDGPCSWPCFVSSSACMSLPLMAYARSAVRGCFTVQGSWGRSPRFGNPAHSTVAAEFQKSASISPHWLVYASHAVDLKRPPVNLGQLPAARLLKWWSVTAHSKDVCQEVVHIRHSHTRRPARVPTIETRDGITSTRL